VIRIDPMKRKLTDDSWRRTRISWSTGTIISRA
jgi:hypothetical protein